MCSFEIIFSFQFLLVFKIFRTIVTELRKSTVDGVRFYLLYSVVLEGKL